MIMLYLTIFSDTLVKEDAVAVARESFMLTIYGIDRNETSNEAVYHVFQKEIVCASVLVVTHARTHAASEISASPFSVHAAKTQYQ